MKKLLAIGINIFIVVICLLLLHVNDVHVVKADALNKSKSKNINISTNIGEVVKNNNTNVENEGNNKKSLNTVDLSPTVGSVQPVVKVQDPISLSYVETPSLERQVGTISAYGPDCSGCSGHLGGGFDASDGSYIYNDPTYGNIRIVAGDPQYPYGTIVKISGTKAGDFNAIVLDRGGNIGIGRRFLFDLLFSTEAEAAAFGTSYDVTVDVLRFGY